MDSSLPFVSPVLVAREPELTELTARYAAAERGEGQVVVLAGEAGIGKTRLLGELAQGIGERGGRTLTGHCFESERARPFGLIRDLAHAIARQPGYGGADRDRYIADLAAIAPELAGVIPGGASPAAGMPPDWRRISFAITSLLAQHHDPAPLLLVFEDVHWSDDASLNCVLHIARGLGSQPVLMVMTCRREDATPALRHLLAEFHRSRLATEIDLEPLREGATAAMVRSIFDLDRPPRAELVKTLQQLTDGNPFFIEEVLASLVATGGIFRVGAGWERKRLTDLPVPRSITDAVQARLAHVSAAARDLLLLAAIAGQRIEIDILAELADLDEASLSALMRELIAAHMLVEEPDDRVGFRHALIRLAIEGDLLARERRALHRRVFEVLARLDQAQPGRYLDALSHQAYGAGIWQEALRYGMEAGANALALGAPHAALEHLDHAIEAASALGIPAPALVWRERGRAHETVGDFDAARSDYETSLAEARRNGDAAAAWQANLDLGLLWCSRDYPRAFGFHDEALRLAREMGDDAAIAHSLNRMGNWLVNTNQPDAAMAHHDEALAIFSRLGDRRGEAASHELMSMVSMLRGDLPGVSRHGRQAATIYRELGDRTGESRSIEFDVPAAVYEVSTFAGRGAIRDAIAWFTRALDHAREVDSAVSQAECFGGLGQCFAAAGLYGQAIEALDASIAIGRDIGHAQWTAQSLWILGQVCLDLGQRRQGMEHLQAAAAIAASMQSGVWSGLVSGGMASALILDGDTAGAAKVLDAAMTGDLPMVMQGQRALWAARIELLLATGQSGEALALVDRMLATAPNLAHDGQIPRLAILKARALEMLGEHEAAATLLRSALAWSEGQGALPQELRVQTALATLLASTGDLAAAGSHAAAAQGLIDRISAAVPAGELRDTYVRTATSALPRALVRRPGQGAGGLSPRETEVAALVRDGLTNREIAGRLFISERTAETHVAGIMRKLGVGSRSQIAAWAAGELPPAQSSPRD
jgi:DNA-binding CsgD family transcriptional regulator/tetratricopeptide (TPR) repeat protein